jgi:hypothetical protein
MIYQGKAKYPVTEICLHASATRPEWMQNKGVDAKHKEIKRWHVKERGWNDIGYHWIDDRDGQIKAGRDMSVIGAGVLGHNRGVIHLCMIGGHGGSSTDKFSDHFTNAQLVSLMVLFSKIDLKTKISVISGHNQFANKGCPCFDVPRWWSRIKEHGYAA